MQYLASLVSVYDSVRHQTPCAKLGKCFRDINVRKSRIYFVRTFETSNQNKKLSLGADMMWVYIPTTTKQNQKTTLSCWSIKNTSKEVAINSTTFVFSIVDPDVSGLLTGSHPTRSLTQKSQTSHWEATLKKKSVDNTAKPQHEEFMCLSQRQNIHSQQCPVYSLALCVVLTLTV